ncbi:MAG TPA: DUF3566 domain-containing protein [Mycobacteriales bacterium]|nr:DUF3566 domain-containing protein [Mycobacteriales bacterium]
MSDANGSADQGAHGAGGSSTSTDATARSETSASYDEQSTVSVGPTSAKPRPVSMPQAPTPAWPPVLAPGSGNNGGGSSGNSNATRPSPHEVQQPQSPLDRVAAVSKSAQRPTPEHVVAAAHVDSHAMLSPKPQASREKFQFSEAVNKAREAVASAAGRGPRRARLQLKKIDPWSMMKFSFAVAFVLFVMGVVASAILYTVLDAMGVFDSLNETVRSLTTSDDSSGTAFEIDAKFVIGGSALLGAVNMVLFTAMATLGAFIYNVCADLAGGVELTLAERE